MSTTKNSRISVRLDSELKRLIEEAAVALGQSISEFTIATVVREARQVIQESQFTHLSNQDRDAFLDALDDAAAKPNDDLKTAARRYNKRIASDG